MHPKRGKLFNQLVPKNVESVGCAVLTELCRTDDKRMASCSKNLADPLQTFGQAGR